MTTLVTGGSGVIGGAVARALAGRIPVAVAARTLPDARHLDYDDPTTYPAALRGIRTVFLVAPPADPNAAERLAPFLTAAVRGGVEHIAVNSAPIARIDRDISLARIERAVEAAGCAWTHVRSQWHMSSFTVGVFAGMVATGELALPTGSSGIAYVDPADVGDAVATVLTDPAAHAGATYELTGPQILDCWAVARLLDLRYRPVDDDSFLDRCGMPREAARFLLGLLTVARNGACEYTTDTVARLTGHPPGTFEAFLTRSDGHGVEDRSMSIVD